MLTADKLGRIIVLNGVPRSGKTSIARVIQDQFNGVWMNPGVDTFMGMTPEKYQPGIGLRPGGELPGLEGIAAASYRALYMTAVAFSRSGINSVIDAGHHEGFSVPLGILTKCAEIVEGLPAMLAGIRCPVEVIMERRIATWKKGFSEDGSIPAAVLRWQEAVHQPGLYDVEVDTSILKPWECADIIHERLEQGEPFTAFEEILTMKKME
ncbi:chloramphenicol phosphotransferase CPT family protein [Peribacillus sp. SCS-26]|uniref:chloramphenicol phosphotransferase CPT family protein n=1 Tax=Paraperibacillus marinus TaxID=3115295 RepID=UPI00390644ED